MSAKYTIITVSIVGSALALFLFWSTVVGVDVILVWLVVLSCDDAYNLICQRNLYKETCPTLIVLKFKLYAKGIYGKK